MWIRSILPLLVLLLPFVSAQIGTCSSGSVNSFLLALPNGRQCAEAFQNVLFPTSSNESVVDASLDVFCTLDCGAPLARYSALTCGDPDFAVTLVLYCLTSMNETERCRSIFPDLVNGSIVPLIATTCANFDTECHV